MPTLRRKPVDLPAWHLTDMTQMAAAFTALTVEGWRGGINADQYGELRLEVNRDNPSQQIVAHIGDWLVLDIELRRLTASQFDDHYEIGAGS